jgi:hypothetical protein
MKRDPAVTVLMVIGGILLLLPAACVVVVTGAVGMPRGDDWEIIVPLWLVCFAISGAGVYLIIKAFRNPPG